MNKGFKSALWIGMALAAEARRKCHGYGGRGEGAADAGLAL
jgi:hypothetical protein